MLGISSKNARIRDWLETLARAGFKLIELNHRVTPFEYRENRVEDMRAKMKKYSVTLTIHSGVSDVMHHDPTINESQILMLKSEIKYASELGIKYVTFHISESLDHGKHKKRINEFLTEILRHAKRYKVKLVLENDSKGAWCNPDDMRPYFKKHRTLKHLLDIGHLNRAVIAKLVKSEQDYLDKLGPYVEYVHLHGNHGTIDEHKAVDHGNLKLDILLPAIKKLRPSITIIETNDLKEAIKSKKFLKKHGFS